MRWNPIVNAVVAMAYIGAVVFVIHYISSFRHDTPDTIIDGVGLLSLFVFSAAVMGFLFFYRPAVLMLEGKRAAALTYFAQMLAAFAVITAIVLSFVVMQAPSSIGVPEPPANNAERTTQTLEGVWECLPPKDANSPHTLECAFGIRVGNDHYAVDTAPMGHPVDYPTGTKVRVSGTVTPVAMLNSIQKYDIIGVISATGIERE